MITEDGYTAMLADTSRSVVRHFQRYTPGQRANAASSHRLGRRQVMAVGQAFYTHPARPGVAFDTRQAAARAGLEAEIVATLAWLRLWFDRFDVIVIHTSAGKDSQTALRWSLALCELAGVMDRVAVLHLVLDRDPRDWHPPLVTEPRVEWQQVPELAAEQASRRGVPLAAADGWSVQDAYAAGRSLTRGDWAGRMHYARRCADWDRRPAEKQPFYAADLWEDVATRRKRDGALRGWPTMWTRYCTSDWKTAVGRAFTQALCGGLALGRPARVLQVMGFRAQESPDRADRPWFGLNAGVTAPTIRRVWEWLPIHDMLLPEVWADIRESGVPYHPVYDEGMARLSCRFCVLANPRDLATARRLAPAAAGAVIAIEEAIGDPFQAKIKKTVRNKVTVAETKIPLPLSAVEPADGRPGFDVHWLTCSVCGVATLAAIWDTQRNCPQHAAGPVPAHATQSTPGCQAGSLEGDAYQQLALAFADSIGGSA